MRDRVSIFTNPRTILSGKFNYKETYQTFLRSTNQKKEAAEVLRLLGDSIGKYIFPKDKTSNIVDLGCADGVPGLHYLKTLNPTGLCNYIGVENNDDFTKDASLALSSSPLINDFSLINEDPFSGLLSFNKALASKKFAAVLISHAAYSINDPAKCELILKDISNLIAPTGLAIFLHEKYVENQFQYFRFKYGNFRVNDIAEKFELAAINSQSNQFQPIQFDSSLVFSPLSDEHWEAMKYPSQYNQINNVNFIANLERLSFIVQRDFLEMELDGSLSSYIEEVRAVIHNNNNQLDITNQLQVFTAQNCIITAEITRATNNLDQELKGNRPGYRLGAYE
ncbi:MAG: hypothetical protein H0U73_07660 [Tatlockia sp.]|nr:hypothetical protein [Tatlockia sp.]